MRRIIGITFDLDDTLYDNRPVLERAERVLHAWLARRYPRVVEHFDITGLRRLRSRVAEAHPHLQHDLSVIRKLTLSQAAQACGYEDELVEPAFQVFLRARNQVQMYADVLPALGALRSRYALGALTNGNADIEQLGLAPLLQTSAPRSRIRKFSTRRRGGWVRPPNTWCTWAMIPCATWPAPPPRAWGRSGSTARATPGRAAPNPTWRCAHWANYPA